MKRTPPDASAYNLPVHVECPFCQRAHDTELHSPFGPQLSVATYWCNRCHTAFDFIKWQGTSSTAKNTKNTKTTSSD